MKRVSENKIVYIIAGIILITISIQVYWNIKNYKINRLQLINDVQTALDNSVDFYYTDLAKTNIKSANEKKEIIHGDISHSKGIQLILDSIISRVKHTGKTPPSDTTVNVISMSSGNFHIENVTDEILKDSILKKTGTVNELATKIVISLSNEVVDFKKLSKVLNSELAKRGFNFKYAMSQSKNEKQLNEFHNSGKELLPLTVESRSAYLPEGSAIKLNFPDVNALALKASLIGMLLSLLLSVSIIAALLYMLKIINRQKQVALIKNDFISNISHELKTPITISISANEAIQRFSGTGDGARAEKYLNISNEQLQKLSLMVEKILETATLDTDQLQIKKENTDIVQLVQNTIDKQQLKTAKELLFESGNTEIMANVDIFHFENVIANIIENAVKYGGNTIETVITHNAHFVDITVTDNGTPIDKSQKEKIFDKFYRIPQNNLHDVKGYGIGLFYARKIIEKHAGTIILVPNVHKTVFKITLSCLIK